MAIFKAVQLDQQDWVPIGAWQTDIKGAPSQVMLYVSRTNRARCSFTWWKNKTTKITFLRKSEHALSLNE